MNESDTSSPRVCPNCGTVLMGHYCSKCGQEDHSLAVPLYRLILDFLSDNFQFDSRLGRTLWLLLFRPGQLTREYLSGKRQRYIPPIRLYLFISIIFFLIVGLLPAKLINFNLNVAPPGHASAPANTTRMAAIEATVRKAIAHSLPASSAAGMSAVIRKHMAEAAHAQALPTQTASSPLKRWIQARSAAIKARPAEFKKQIWSNMPKVLFFLIPIFAILLKLLYLQRKRYYSEHLIFALHYHSVLFLNLLVMVAVLAAVPAALSAIALWINSALGVWLVIYLFSAMKTVYKSGWWDAVWRGSTLLFLYFFTVFWGTMGAIVVTFAMS